MRKTQTRFLLKVLLIKFLRLEGKVSFVATDKYIVGESDGDVMANRDAIGDWEKFSLELQWTTTILAALN